MQRVQSVVGVTFSSDRKSVLLIRRRDVPIWVLPGGGVETGETAEQAILREMTEETGFEMQLVRLSGVYTPVNRLTRFTHVYECAALQGTARLSDETLGVQFFPLDALPPMPPPYPEWIQEAFEAGSVVYKPLTSVNYKTLFKYMARHPLLVTRFLLSRMGWAINTQKVIK